MTDTKYQLGEIIAYPLDKGFRWARPDLDPATLWAYLQVAHPTVRMQGQEVSAPLNTEAPWHWDIGWTNKFAVVTRVDDEEVVAVYRHDDNFGIIKTR